MRRHRYEDYYAQTERRLQKADLSLDAPVFAESTLEGLTDYQSRLVQYAEHKFDPNTRHGQANRHRLELEDELQDSLWSRGDPAGALQALLEASSKSK